MVTPVFLTADIEFAWRHHAAGHDLDGVYQRSIEPAGVGLAFQLETLRRHELKACFFVDPMPALLFGLDPIRRIVDAVLEAEQEVQLHLHPNWAGARADDAGEHYGRFQLHEYDFADQSALIAGATDLLAAAGAPPPIAFRAGNYGANDDTLRVLAAHGFTYDSSHNGAQASRTSRLSLPPRRISPVAGTVIEVPVTVIEDSPGSLRTFQLCALSSNEASDALDHAAAAGHAAVTIVSHGFELANRAGTRANMVHVRRFQALCSLLDDRRDDLPTVHFKDRPSLRLDADDAPLAPDMLRTRWRQAEQLWSNWVAERAA
jgi:hypothetical protein